MPSVDYGSLFDDGSPFNAIGMKLMCLLRHVNNETKIILTPNRHHYHFTPGESLERAYIRAQEEESFAVSIYQSRQIMKTLYEFAMLS